LNTHIIPDGKTRGRKIHGRYKRRCEDDIEMELTERLREVVTSLFWLTIVTSLKLVMNILSLDNLSLEMLAYFLKISL
jgi:hypothetical protein